MPKPIEEQSLTSFEIEQITQAALDAAVAAKRMMAIVDPICSADPRLRQAAQVYLEAYAKEFGVPDEVARAGFAGLEDAIAFEMAARRMDS